MSVKRQNSSIRFKVVNMYKDFVSEVDPRDVLDLLIQRRVISFDRRDELLSRKTRQDCCRALLDQLFYCSHDEAFVVLREALDEHYHWIVERIDSFEGEDQTENIPLTNGVTQQRMFQTNHSTETNSFDSLESVTESDLEIKLTVAHRRIAELEYEVIQYRRHNAELIRQLSFLQISYDEARVSDFNPGRRISDNIFKNRHLKKEFSTDGGQHDWVRSRSQYVKKTTYKNTNALSGSDDFPSPPPRKSKSVSELASLESGGPNGTRAVGPTRHLLVSKIKGSSAVRGMVMMDSILYVVRFGLLLVEMYEEKENFRKSKRKIIIPSQDKKTDSGLKKLFSTSPFRKAHVSSGIQDIAGCPRNKLLYVSDWQGKCVHCLNPKKRDVVRSWTIEAGAPWGISITSYGSVVVCCGDNGQLCEYSSEGTLTRTVNLEKVDEGPWHGFLYGLNSWIICHGERGGPEGYMYIADVVGNHSAGGCKEVVLHRPSHMAILPDNRILVAESGRNRVVMLGQSLQGPVREIFNSDDGITMPVRLHYYQSSGQLCVGLHDGSILIYQMTCL